MDENNYDYICPLVLIMYHSVASGKSPLNFRQCTRVIVLLVRVKTGRKNCSTDGLTWGAVIKNLNKKQVMQLVYGTACVRKKALLHCNTLHYMMTSNVSTRSNETTAYHKIPYSWTSWSFDWFIFFSKVILGWTCSGSLLKSERVLECYVTDTSRWSTWHV